MNMQIRTRLRSRLHCVTPCAEQLFDGADADRARPQCLPVQSSGAQLPLGVHPRFNNMCRVALYCGASSDGESCTGRNGHMLFAVAQWISLTKQISYVCAISEVGR